MKLFKIIVVLITLTACSATNIQTQTEMNIQSRKEALTDQEKLAVLVKQIKEKYADNPEQLKRLEKAQADWEQFVQSQLELLYNKHTSSVAPMCRNITFNRMILQRIEQLKEWLNTEEGDVCGGL